MRTDYLIICFVLVSAFLFHRWNAGRFDPGVAAPEEPRQVLNRSLQPFQISNYTLKPFATFEAKALVLSAKHYFWGQEAELAPVDLALGWGPMSDGNVLKNISIAQGNRWYFFYYRKPSIDHHAIVSHSANVHLIPSDPEIEKALKQVRRGDIVMFRGDLVNIVNSDGWRWNSSSSRTDTGAGSCEIIWVKSFQVVDK